MPITSQSSAYSNTGWQGLYCSGGVQIVTYNANNGSEISYRKRLNTMAARPGLDAPSAGNLSADRHRLRRSGEGWNLFRNLASWGGFRCCACITVNSWGSSVCCYFHCVQQSRVRLKHDATWLWVLFIETTDHHNRTTGRHAPSTGFVDE